MKRLLLVMFLLFSIAAFGAPPVAPELVVSGNWLFDSNSADGVGWKKSNGALVFTSNPSSTSKEYKAIRQEPLPEGDWTIDLWVIFAGDSGKLEMTVGTDAEPAGIKLEANNYSRFTSYELGTFGQGMITSIDNPRISGCVNWVRLSYFSGTGKMLLHLNGIPCWSMPGKKIECPNSPVALTMRLQNPATKARDSVKVVGFEVTPSATETTSVFGPAFSGWTKKMDPSGITSPKALREAVQLVEQQVTTDAGRCYALACAVLSDFAIDKAVSSSNWREVQELVKELMPRDRAGLAILLPIAAECGDAAQREQVKEWTKAYFGVEYISQWSQLDATNDTMSKAMLLDLRAVYRMSMKPSDRELLFWSEALATSCPAISMMPYAIYFGEGDNGMKAPAWLIADLLRVAPTYGSEMLEAIRMYEGKDADLVNSYAAYQLAAVKPDAAAFFLDKIVDPKVKYEAVLCLAEKLPEFKFSDPKLFERLENQLKEATTAEPKAERDTRASRIVKLMDFYVSTGQKDKAQAAVERAEKSLSSSGAMMATDTLAVARVLVKFNPEESSRWLQKALIAAEELESQRDEPDNYSGIYISPLTGIVEELVKVNKTEEAIAVVKKMDKEVLKNNRAMSLDRIILKLVAKDTKKAEGLLSEYPDMRAKYGITGVIAAKIAETDVPAALKLLESIPDESSRTNALMRVVSAIPSSKAGSLLAELQKSYTKMNETAKTGSLKWGVAYSVVNNMASLPLDSLLALRESFTKQPDRYAMYLLMCIGKHCGLDGDPVWDHYWGKAKSAGIKGIPWGHK